MNATFEKIFNGLNNGAMIGNPAYNMQAVAQTFREETRNWSSQTAREYREYAQQRMGQNVKEGGPVWKK